MSIDKDVLLDGVDKWFHLVNKYRLEPKEALSVMEKSGHNVAEVLLYLESILESYTLNHKE